MIFGIQVFITLVFLSAAKKRIFDASWVMLGYWDEMRGGVGVSYVTPPKINVEPEHDGLEDDFPFPGVYSQVPC